MKKIDVPLKNALKEFLEPYGFKKVRGRYPYFVKVINDEIIEVITFRNLIGMGYLTIGGLATVYGREIDFSMSPRDNGDWIDLYDVGIYKRLKFDNVQNMENTLNWLMRYNPGNIIQSDWSLTDDCIAEESLYYLRKKFPLSAFQQNFEELKNEVINSPLVGDEKEKELKEVKEWENELYKDRAEMQINQQNYEQGMQLLREHYDRNVEYLNGIGIAVERRDITDLFD